MALQASYDRIADWYEQEFLSRQRAPAGPPDGDLLGVDRALGDLLGKGSGRCLEIGCGTGVHAARVRGLGWTPVGVDLSAGCCGTPGAGCRSPEPTPSGCRFQTAACRSSAP